MAMSRSIDGVDGIFNVTRLLNCDEIRLFAWCGAHEKSKRLILFTGGGDFVCHNADMENPVIKQICWFKDPAHSPVSICFSPNGCFLLVLSRLCHLYIVPICSALPCPFECSRTLSVTDLTIHTYPFTGKEPCSRLGTAASGVHSCIGKSTQVKYASELKQGTIQNWESETSSFKESKLREILLTRVDIAPSTICWWQSASSSQEIGVIGGGSGEIIFVDLISGLKVGETRVRGKIMNLSVCCDAADDYVFLLITTESGEQYRLTLKQKHEGGAHVANTGHSSNTSNEVPDLGEPTFPGHPMSDSLSSRTRLQGLKKMSAGKLASLKLRIAETRSKMSLRQDAPEEMSAKVWTASPENVGSLLGETVLSPQSHRGENVIAGYYGASQLLTIHSANLDLVPRAIHKMPPETGEVLLCDRTICVVSEGRRALQVVSAKMTETQLDEAGDFNSESVLGRWTFGWSDGKEFILKVWKSVSKCKDVPSCVFRGEMDDFLEAENYVVVTSKNVYVVHLRSNVVEAVMNLILETHELEKAERLCVSFGLNLQKLLELAGDVKLNALEFPTAIALYKLSRCGLLKSIVKLACGSHCLQVLNYSLMLLSNSSSEMSLTEKIHLSNLIIMAYTQQILRTENNRKLVEKFREFLRTNAYFDEVLAVSVTGQSLLFSCLGDLIAGKGLLADGYGVLLKLMERFSGRRALEWSSRKDEFWECATEDILIEAVVNRSASFPTYAAYVAQHLDGLSLPCLNRLSRMLDPTAPCLRPLARVFQDSQSFDRDGTESEFAFGKLIELFILVALVKAKARKEGNPGAGYQRGYLGLQSQEITASRGSSESPDFAEALSDEIWPIRKNAKGFPGERLMGGKRIVSCGYGHSALIRNGSVYTWGQTARGCLGHGPTMARNYPPAPVSWLDGFKVEVSLVACGKNHTVALTNNGVYAWGCSKYGQLGLGTVEKCPHPRLVVSLTDETVVSLSCGQFHTVALTERGSVYAWGWGVHGQLGLGTIDDHRVPRYVAGLREHVIVNVSAGHGHTLALSDMGHVYAFGSGVFGQLGTGTTAKHSSPVLVRGFSGRVTAIATSYFHNLALTELNTLYTWGLSPQCLRFQAQARKKSKLSQAQNGTAAVQQDSADVPLQERSDHGVPNESGSSDRSESELHLAPTPVDTTNVQGKIIQVLYSLPTWGLLWAFRKISCGCHHSALLTDTGALFTWGRSIDGQLGSGGRREIRVPTQVGGPMFQVDSVSCGCEFTVAQEKRTGKIYAWGSNSVGQLALPIKESATKSLDGKLVMLKSCKRVVRLLERNTGSNSVDVPREIPEIPPPTFTCHSLSNHLGRNSVRLSILDAEYSEKSLHYVIENYGRCLDLNLIFEKSLDYENYQAASKVELLRNNLKDSMVYQLKALQSLPKYRCDAPFQAAKTRGPETSAGTTPGAGPTASTDSLDGVKKEYADHAEYILGSYLALECERSRKDSDDQLSILETGIVFWAAEKLPVDSLEAFFSDKFPEALHDLAYLVFCRRRQPDSNGLLRLFSAKFLLSLGCRAVSCVGGDVAHLEFLSAMSTFVRHRPRGSPSPEENLEPDFVLGFIEETLKGDPRDEDHVKVSCADLTTDQLYIFTCGHRHASLNLRRVESILPMAKLKQLYRDMDAGKRCDSACPLCIGIGPR